MAITPHKTDSPLLVYANRVLSLAVAPQCFQLIAGRRTQNAQFAGSVQLQQFAKSDAFEGAEALRVLIVKKRFRFLGAKALDHTQSILRITLYSKRKEALRSVKDSYGRVMRKSPRTRASICVRRKQSRASSGRQTMGSLSLKEVLRTTGTPVRSRKAEMSA